LLVFRVRDVHFFHPKHLGDGEIDLECGDQRLGGLVIELEAFHRAEIAEDGSFRGEFPEILERARFVVFREERGDRLDLVADEDDAVDGHIGKIEA